LYNVVYYCWRSLANITV